MKRLAARTLVFASLSLCVTQSYAGYIYSESVDGDLGGNDISPFKTIFLNDGINKISGSYSGIAGFNDYDNFVFDIPSGFKLLGIKWSATGFVEMTTPEPQTGIFELAFSLFDGGPTNVGALIEKSSVNFTNSELGSFAFQAEGGSDWVMLGPDKVTANGGGNGTYEFQFDVRTLNSGSVPEPSSLALALCGLTGLIVKKAFRGKGTTVG